MSVFRSLRFRLAVGLVLLACLGVGLQFAVFERVAGGVRQDVSQRNMNLAHALSGETANTLAQPIYALNALVENLAEGRRGRELEDSLAAVERYSKVADLVMTLDTSGRVTAVAPPDPDQIDLDLSAQPYFAKARAFPGTVFTQSSLSAQTSGATAVIARGYAGGVVAMQLKVEEISRMVMVLPVRGGGFVAVLDDQGVVVGHSDPGAAHRRENLSTMQAVRKALEGGEGSFEDSYQGAPGIASISPVPGTDWRVLVFEPSSQAYAIVRQLYTYTLWGVAVVAICTALSMLAFQSQLLRPLGDLTAQTQRLAQGGYDVSIRPVFSEFEALASSFTSMAESLKTREQALRESRERLASVVQAMPSFLVAIDGQGRVQQWNAWAEKLTGQSAQSVRGRLLQEALPQLLAALPALSQALCLSVPLKWEKLPVDFGKGRRLLDVLVYPLGAGGCGSGAVLRIDDVTERIRMEEIMVHTEKMMTVGGLAAGMAHEINNPLGGILMSAQNLTRRLSSDLAANREAAREAGIDLAAMESYLKRRGIFEQVETIREMGSRAGMIVSNMLGFSRRSSSGLLPAHPEEMIERALDLAANDYDLKHRMDLKKVTVHRDYAPDLGEVPVNRGQIEQVLINLIKNAVQAMIKTADIRPPELWIKAWRSESEAMIQIRDNGPGIPEEMRERVFEPFFTTKDVGEGTGLGLSVSYYILTTMHRGTIGVESAPEGGASFTLGLPLIPGGARPEDATKGA